MNDKVYIHELIDIIGHNRARYMHHMTANWVPVAIEQRNQRCFGVWGTVGSTGRWPEVINMWELDGWDGLARQAFDQQIRALRRGAHVVVATPGRALDHLRRRTLDFGSLAAVVLDEADEMLDMGFADEIELLLDASAAKQRSQPKPQGGQQAPQPHSLQLLQVHDAPDGAGEAFPVSQLPIERAPAGNVLRGSARIQVTSGAGAGSIGGSGRWCSTACSGRRRA